MKKIFLLLIAFVYVQPIHAQIPDDTNGRLYRLCKTWGYFKYFNQSKCDLKWDTLLNTTINEVLLASTNTEFNNALMTMFSKVGNNAFVSSPGVLPDTNFNFNSTWITDTVFDMQVRNFLDTFSLYIYPDTSTCFLKFNDYSDVSYNSFIDFRNDIITMPLDYTNEADRLTVMFYYWNVINYFHPARYLMDQPWDSSLYQFIPRMRQATNDTTIQITFMQLVTKINDGHGFNGSPALTAGFWGGAYHPQIYFYRIDTICVVKKVANIPGVSPGDVLISVNGIAIHDIEDSLRNYIPASTPAALYRDIYYKMTRGAQNSSIIFELLDSNNISYSVSTTHSMYQPAWAAWYADNGFLSSYFVTQCNYGYVDMGMLQSAQVPSMMAAFQNLPAIIFDMRNYPNGTLWDLGPFLFPGPITSAIYYIPALADVPFSYYYLPGWYNEENDFYNLGLWSNANAYNGNIYILVNEETQSQAEYTCQYISYHPNATVIGSQTAGADGNISYLDLPNGHFTYFTSLGWYYADGYQQQRNGVKIDTLVYPTIEGIRHGRDELLEVALSCVTGLQNSESRQHSLFVYPNPVSNGSTHLLFSAEKSTTVTISLIDIAGKNIRTETQTCMKGKNDFLFDLKNIAPGLYLMRVISGNAEINVKVIIN